MKSDVPPPRIDGGVTGAERLAISSRKENRLPRNPIALSFPWKQVDFGLWAELTRNLAVRDIEIRYKQSLLGLYWAIINPLVTAGILGFVLGVIFHANSKPVPYVVFLFTGVTFWNFFASGVISATVSVTGNAGLLAKLYFPRIVLPTAAALARLIDLAFSLFVLAIFITLYRVPVHLTVLWLIPLLAAHAVLTLGIGYIVAALNVLYRDTQQLTGLVLMIWMYISPVMYPFASVPTQFQKMFLFNPMSGLLQAERDAIFTGRLTQPLMLYTSILAAALLFFIGLSVFKLIEPLFAEVM